MQIQRIYDISKLIQPQKVLLIYGPRRVGKTTLIENFLEKTTLPYLSVTGDDIKAREALGSQRLEKILDYIKDYKLLCVDEAQRIPHIGVGLKMIVDHVKDIFVIATGSSSFQLAGQVGEPLTGRKWSHTLYPVSQMELQSMHNRYELSEKKEEYLVFGGYPEVLAAEFTTQKRKALIEIVNSYLLKDILEFEGIKKSQILVDLLRLLAFQVGSEVSLTELGQKLSLDGRTTARYIDILCQSFILFPLHGFSRNLRKEITKKSKYYFFDNGIRNALISNFNELALRDDVGKLWENFLVVERLKKQAYIPLYANNYFWRTWDQQEVDFVEEREGKLFGYEFSWQQKKKKQPKDWLGTYKEATLENIHSENYLDFVL